MKGTKVNGISPVQLRINNVRENTLKRMAETQNAIAHSDGPVTLNRLHAKLAELQTTLANLEYIQEGLDIS